MKFEVVRAVRANLPALKLPVELLEKIGKIGEGSILQNIKNQQTMDGGQLQENAPSTRRRKERKGRPLKSLVDQFHRFTRGRGQSWALQVEPHRNWVILEPATQELRNLSRWLQEGRPSKGKYKYLGWFGLNEKAAKLVREVTRAWVRDEFEKARRKQGST